MDRLQKFAERGYVVNETVPVYLTTDMDKTAKWFEEILGWYYEIIDRNAEGQGTYGAVYDIPKEIENLHIAPFTGIHLFFGEPVTGFGHNQRILALIKVKNIDALYRYVKSKNWKDITEIQEQYWGAKLCTITTPDGYELQFFE